MSILKYFFNNYKYYITNYFKRLIEKKENLEISISIRIILILTITSIYIQLTKFLKVDILKILFNIDRKILKKIVVIKKIWTNLIFSKCIRLNWCNYCQFKAIYTSNHKDNMIKAEKKI